MQRLTTTLDLDKLGAPPDLQRGLEALRARIQTDGTGAIRCLFVGSSNSGQAPAAASLGKAVGMEVFRVDLSAVVSRYIGETEKNLDRIFADAAAAHAILFLDEADALFGKRSEVHDSHDRYANLETGYLLKKLEAYGGPAILAARSLTNVDPAFLRRLRCVLHFDVPNQPRSSPANARTVGIRARCHRVERWRRRRLWRCSTSAWPGQGTAST